MRPQVIQIHFFASRFWCILRDERNQWQQCHQPWDCFYGASPNDTHALGQCAQRPSFHI